MDKIDQTIFLILGLAILQSI